MYNYLNLNQQPKLYEKTNGLFHSESYDFQVGCKAGTNESEIQQFPLLYLYLPAGSSACSYTYYHCF